MRGDGTHRARRCYLVVIAADDFDAPPLLERVREGRNKFLVRARNYLDAVLAMTRENA
jgi:hypothetical protein